MIFDLVIQKLNEEKVYDVTFESDEYWRISINESKDFSKTPEPNVGSLFDDISELKASISNKEIITYLDFSRLAAVLMMISEIRAPTK